jgi:hypothetical protein
VKRDERYDSEDLNRRSFLPATGDPAAAALAGRHFTGSARVDCSFQASAPARISGARVLFWVLFWSAVCTIE